MPSVSINGTSLYFEDHGSGTPIIFIHGMYGNHAAWYQQVAELAADYRIVTLDLRGFGLSEDLNALGSGGSTDDVSGLMDHLHIEKAVLVGQSMGGAASLVFANSHPQRVQALALAGSVGGIKLPDDLAARQAEFAKRAEDLPLPQRMFSGEFLDDEPPKVELFRQLIGFNRGASKYFLTGNRLPAPTLEQLQQLSARVPVLLMVGNQDVVQPPEIVAGLADLLPSAELSILAGSGHSAYFEQPDTFNACLLRFVEIVLSREQPSVRSGAST